MASPFTVYTGNDNAALTTALFAPNSGITASSIQLKASGQDAVNFYAGSLAPLSIGGGLLLTSGTTPGTSNTAGWFGTDNSASGFFNGDADIDAVVNSVFQTQSFDATTLSFDFTVADPTATSVSFDLVFGSDEFPEWVDQYVDSAIVMVNGVNYALFNHDPLHPLSVVSANLAAGYFQDNAGNTLPIEYDGVSHVLKIVAPIFAGGATNHIKIGIADTGDHIYDSGIFLSNFTAGTIPGSGVVSASTTGTAGDDVLTGSSQDEYFDLQSGNDTVYAGLGDDIVVAGAGNDVIYGGSGADQMKGDAGDDIMDGGVGSDTAVYAGNKADFNIAFHSASGTYTIAAKIAGTVAEGADTLTGIEFAKFGDGLWSLGDTGVVALVSETPTVTPTSNQSGTVFISGIGGQGQVLTATVSDANGVPSTVSYGWQANGVDLGVSGNSFLVGAAQVGQSITVTASYNDLASNTEFVTSAVKVISAPGNGDFAIALLNLSAPVGASVMTPLTTLVKNAIDLGVTPNEAGLIIKNALSLDATVDLQHYDAWAALQTNPEDSAALAVEKIAVQVAVMTSLGSDETGMALTQAILLAHSSGVTLNLTDKAEIANLLGLDVANSLVHEIWDRNDTISDAATVADIEAIWADIQSGLSIVLSDSIGTLSVHINQAPVGTATASLVQGLVNVDYTVSTNDLLTGFSDADGDTLSVAGLTVSNGSATDNGNGTFTISLMPDYTGPVELAYVVLDDQGGSALANQLFVIPPSQVISINDAPTGTASAVLAAGSEDIAYTVNTSDLLQGFSDVEGDTLSVSDLSASNGSVTDNGNGSYTISPALNFNGAVNLTYNVTDGNGGTLAAAQSYSLAAINDAPTGTASAVLAAGGEDIAYTVNTSDLLQGFSDVEGDTLSVSGLSASNGSVTDNGNGSYTISPALNFNGAVNLTYNVTDGNGGTLAAAQSYSLAAINDAPTGTASAVLASGSEDIAYTVNTSDLLQGFSDLEGDTLSVSGLSASNGSVTDNGNGSYTISPTLNFNGVVNLTYNVTDDNGGMLAAAQSYMVAVAAGLTLTGTARADSLFGGGQDDTLYGLGGNDTLNGMAGNDTMMGGSGNDTYVVDSMGDLVTELAGAGTDLVKASVSYMLAGNVENLTLTGTDSINGTGNMFANKLIGNSGNNVLDGGAGNDKMAGGAGDDIYHVDSARDDVVETLNAGSDTVISSLATYTLGSNVENLTLVGANASKGIGNSLANMLLGNAANNILSGLTGNDLLDGGAGDDLLIGGAGNDVLTGGNGVDIFRFDSKLSAINNFDTILDFQPSDDTIQLENAVFTQLKKTGVLSANNFSANADGKAQDANDYIVYDTDSGAVYYDADGNGMGSAIQFVTLLGQPTITAADFFVI
jgi:Ca2+-binding RTX toxin-like protein